MRRRRTSLVRTQQSCADHHSVGTGVYRGRHIAGRRQAAGSDER